MNSFSYIFYGKHHGSQLFGASPSSALLCVPRATATQEPLPLGICSQCAPAEIALFLPNLGRDRSPSQKMSPVPSSSRRQGEGRRGWEQKRGRTKYAPGQCYYCCTFCNTELSMTLSINSLTTEKTRNHC